jgi:hypothetical protein
MVCGKERHTLVRPGFFQILNNWEALTEYLAIDLQSWNLLGWVYLLKLL